MLVSQVPPNSGPFVRITKSVMPSRLRVTPAQMPEIPAPTTTTIGQIADRSGVSRTVLFRHFCDKATLHRAALEPSAADRQLSDELRAAARPESEARRKLLDAARDLFSEQGFGNTATRQIAA